MSQDRPYFTWDYLSLLFEMEPDQFHVYLGILEAHGQRHVGNEVFKSMTKVRALGASDGGKRRYVFNAWGHAARVIAYLPASWSTFVRRIDIKNWNIDVTGGQVDVLAHQLLVKPNPYNITVINSRPRLKTDDRDAGGKGLAIGSHKSDLRVSIYSRGGSSFCQEFQCRDRMLRRFLEAARGAHGPKVDDMVFWLTVKEHIQAAGEQRYGRALYAAGIGDYVPTLRPDNTGQVFEVLDDTGKLDEQFAQLGFDDDAPTLIDPGYTD